MAQSLHQACGCVPTSLQPGPSSPAQGPGCRAPSRRVRAMSWPWQPSESSPLPRRARTPPRHTSRAQAERSGPATSLELPELDSLSRASRRSSNSRSSSSRSGAKEEGDLETFRNAAELLETRESEDSNGGALRIEHPETADGDNGIGDRTEASHPRGVPANGEVPAADSLGIPGTGRRGAAPKPIKGSAPQRERPPGSLPAWLPPAPAIARPRGTHNAAMLAYIGDSIYETYARWHFLNPPVAIPGYCKRVMSVVCCEAQDMLLKRLERAGSLTIEEQDVLRWGRNASTGARRAKGRAGSSVYANATALETLVSAVPICKGDIPFILKIGYLYLSNTDRLHQLMLQLGFTCHSSDLIVPDSLFNQSRTLNAQKQGGS